MFLSIWAALTHLQGRVNVQNSVYAQKAVQNEFQQTNV